MTIALPAIKAVATLVTSFGVGTVVSNVVAATTPMELTLVKRAGVFIGKAVLSGMIMGTAAKYVESEIDGVVKMMNDFAPPATDENVESKIDSVKPE